MVCRLNQCHHATRSYYPDTEPTSPCPILTMPSAWLGSDKYQFKSHWLNLTGVQTCRLWTRTHDLQIPQSPRTRGGCSTHSATLTGTLPIKVKLF